MSKIDEKIINTIRVLSIEAIQKAKSGHPGLPMGSAPMAYTLWAKEMKHNPANPNWVDRDRFILSAGHGSMLLYSLFHLFGYGTTIDDIKNFRQFGSKTPGHPEYGHTIGVETTTGPLGQGISTAVGMAIAEANLAAKFNKPNYEVVNHNTYALVGDGCLMEGISAEASSLAGTLKLGKLIVLYDSNSITIEGSTNIAFSEDVAKRYESYNWQVLNVEDGCNIEAIQSAVKEAKKETTKPTLIIIKTIIGFGCPAKQGKSSAHGEPLGEENVKLTKEYLKYESQEPFYVAEDVKAHMTEVKNELSKNEEKWNELWKNYSEKYPELANEWDVWHSDKLPIDLYNDKNFWKFEGKAATRMSSYEIINRLSKVVPNLIGGSADLAPSTKTLMQNRKDFSSEDYSGSNLHFGIREQAMAAIGNGIELHGGFIAYVSTFFVFSDYMKGSMRLSAIMKLPLTYILTHDSIGVGEDGPTHEPIEQLASLRSIPNFTVFRPADSKETAAAWYSALTRNDGPTAIVLSRQNLPLYNETGKEALKGAYILLDSEKETPDIILMASGSEVELIYEAAKVLKDKGIDARIVSVPSFELFEKQTDEYKNSILPNNVRKRLAVEAASSFGWHKYVGLDGSIISIDTFGASAPANKLFEYYGFTVDNVVEKAIDLLK
ncbi:MAG: transketolase [Bacillota bacterium]|nr:transketolase [Bacillota bacterium]